MNKLLILVVEDDTSVRNLITTTLKAHGYRHQTAANGQTAILEASSYNPDIVLLDLGLPDMDGVEIIRKIRSWSNMPIIVISARSEDNDKIVALDAGADDYLMQAIFRRRIACKAAGDTEKTCNHARGNPGRKVHLHKRKTDAGLRRGMCLYGWKGITLDTD